MPGESSRTIGSARMSQRNRPCPCGSGKRYKHCCGAIGAVPAGPAPAFEQADPSLYNDIGYFRDELRGEGMAPFCAGIPAGRASGLSWAPPGLIVIDDFLDEATCRHWRDVFARQRTTPATVQEVDEKNPGGPPRFKLDEQRVTEFVPLGRLEPEIHRVLLGAYRDVITPYFGKELEWMSPPSVLKYVPGGKYNGHADSEYWDAQRRRWVRSMDRDFSLLLYVNDDYEGGTLYFQNFDLRIRPSEGMLIAFPSDHRYLHAAEPLKSGERYAVVGWGAVRGVPKVNPMPQGAVLP